MANHLGQHAVVIGGSIAGLMTARVLAHYFGTVTVIERDHIEPHPALHKSIPQGSHLHAILLGGQQVMATLYPGFLARLDELGSVRCRAGEQFVVYLPSGKAYTFSGSVREPRDLGIDSYCQSRGLLEYCVRQCTLENTNIRFWSECVVDGLLSRGSYVEGVRCRNDGGSDNVAADLVIDAGGRGSHAPRWLDDLGFELPSETTIGVDFAYSSTKFRIPDDYDRCERLIAVTGPAPDFPNAGIMEIIEGDTWHVTLAGRFGNYPPRDESGFFNYAKTLPTTKLYDLIKAAERVSDITSYRFPTSVWRHYERLQAFPDGFVVLGDAIASFNPFYGQGMSSAALQVKALQDLLGERAADGRGLAGLGLEFFLKAAEVVANPWTLAANLDLAFPKTEGERPPNFREALLYFMAVDALAADDVEVQRLLAEVGGLCKPLSVLNGEPLRSRALARLKVGAHSPA
jgi:2-polyprenyl-6-methoxyphenol hydroxylase-like FAD-dependent oxidoreductase